MPLIGDFHIITTDTHTIPVTEGDTRRVTWDAVFDLNPKIFSGSRSLLTFMVRSGSAPQFADVRLFINAEQPDGSDAVSMKNYRIRAGLDTTIQEVIGISVWAASDNR